MSIFVNIARRFIVSAPTTKSDGLRAAFDLEADGLLYIASKVYFIVIVDLDSGEISEYGPDQIDAALEHLSRADYLVGHNIQGYDLPLLERLHGWKSKPDCAILDTLVAGRLILPNIADLDDQAAAMGGPKLGELRGRYSLEAWGARLGIPKVGVDITDWSTWTPEMQARCVGDVALTKALWRFLQPDGYSQEALKLEHRVAPICERITADGVPFDIEAAERLRQQWEVRRAELAAPLHEQFPGTNLNARPQIGDLLEARGWVPKERTKKTGRPKITDEVLETIPALYPEFTGIAEYDLLRRRIAQLATGQQAWLKHIGDDGRIHGGLIHIGTPHSRAKHLSPNLAQTPNPKKGAAHAAECRALFRHPGDWVFVQCDQDNFQNRAFADRLAEFDGGAYAQAFLAGEDRHWKNAIALGLVSAGTERDKDSKLHTTIREWAKTFGYGFLFGAGVGRCTETLTDALRAIQNIDPSYTASTDGGRARERFIAAIPGLAQLKAKLEALVARHEWLPGLDGRQVPCRAQYTALNYMVASMEAVVCKRWLVHTFDELNARYRYGWDGDVVIVLWVHDEIVCCCRPEIADEVGELMVQHAVEAGEFYGLKVPLAAEYKIGRSWAGEPVEAGAKLVELDPANAVTPELAPIADEVEVVAADDDDPLAELLDGDNHSDRGEIKIERADFRNLDDNEIAAIFDEGDRIRPTRAPEFYCQSCGRNFKNTRLAPMLHNEIWCQLTDKRGTLCGKCMFDRAIERGVTLTIANLRPCRFNLSGSPQSWFDIFLCTETRPLENLATWQAVAVEWLGPQDGLLAAEATLRTLARLPRAVRGNGQSSGAGDDSAQRAARADPRAGGSGGNGAGADDRPPWSPPTITEVPRPKLEQIVAALSAKDRAIERLPKPNSGGAKSYHGSGNGKFHCPFHDDNTPSLQIYSDTDDPHYHCFGCGKHGPLSDLPDELVAATAAAPRQQADDAETLAYAHRLWEAAGPIAGTLAERYLAETRGVDLDALPPDVDRALRFHPACPFNGGRHPCLLALFRDVGTDEPAGIHRIALTPEARKIDRRMLGRWPRPRAIKLWPATDRLYWGEGIETVGAAATRVMHRGAPMQPAWAAGSSGNLAKLPIIPGVERLIILVDNDLNGAGQAAATRCVERWSRAGHTVIKLTPKRPGADFNDIAKEKAP